MLEICYSVLTDDIHCLNRLIFESINIKQPSFLPIFERLKDTREVYCVNLADLEPAIIEFYMAILAFF